MQLRDAPLVVLTQNKVVPFVDSPSLVFRRLQLGCRQTAFASAAVGTILHLCLTGSYNADSNAAKHRACRRWYQTSSNLCLLSSGRHLQTGFLTRSSSWILIM